MELFQSWSSWSKEGGHVPELPPPRPVQNILDKARITEGQTVLDIGAGIGWLSIPSAQRVQPNGIVIALEPAQDSRENLRSHSQKWHVEDSISVVGARAENIPLERETVDLAITRSTLIYVQDKERAIAESWRVLCPDGSLVLSEPLNRYNYLRDAGFYHSEYLAGLGALGGRISGLMRQFDETYCKLMIDFTEHDLVESCWRVGFSNVSVQANRSVSRRTLTGDNPFEAIGWNFRGAATQPTPHEYLAKHLSPIEMGEFTSFVNELFQREQVSFAVDGGRCIVRAVK